MKARVRIDPGKGRVYEWEAATLEQARASVRGRYYRDCKILIETARFFEAYQPIPTTAHSRGILGRRFLFREYKKAGTQSP